MSVVCVGPKDEPNELECIDMSKESIRQAAAGTCVHVHIWISGTVVQNIMMEKIIHFVLNYLCKKSPWHKCLTYCYGTCLRST